MAEHVAGTEGRVRVNNADSSSASDRRSFIEAPVIAALNGITVRAVIGFSVVAASASLPLILRLDALFHEAFHFLLLVGWLVYAALTAALLILRPPPPEPDVWVRAAEVDSALVRFARRVSALMMVGWLASVAAVLVHHHLTSPREVFVTLGIIVPLTFAAWLLAVLAWSSWCRASLARAEHDAADRLRRYWRRVAQPRAGP